MSRLVLAALACAGVGVGACGGDDADGCEEPEYLGAATDEAWRTMVDAADRAIVGTDDAPEASEPTEGAEISAAGDGFRIAWTSTIATAPRSRVRPAAAAADGVWDTVRSLVEGTAWAHLPPVTGDVYLVRIAVPDRECPVEALTTDLEWDVSGERWRAVSAAVGQTVTIEITSAYLTENRVTEGPYRAQTVRQVAIVP